jgi:hypothetical protein
MAYFLLHDQRQISSVGGRVQFRPSWVSGDDHPRMDHPRDPAEDAQQDVQGDLCGAAVFGDDGQWGEKDGFEMGTWSIERM